MLTKYNFLISEQLRFELRGLLIQILHNPFHKHIFNFILQFENYWMIINADSI